MKIILIYASGWFGMLILAILNGAARDGMYARYMTELSAHQLSTLSAIILFGIYIWYFTGFFQIELSKQALLIGGMWFLMTVAFEFVFGRYVMGHSWHKLLQDYNLLQGRVWPLILIWTALAPLLFFRIRSRKKPL